MENKLYLIKSGDGNFIEETETIIGVTGGNVGIGTTNPSHTLDVNGTIGLNVLDTGYGYIGFQIGGDAYTGPKIKATSGNSLFFAADDDDTKNLIINSSGNVGIGTNNPVQALEISGANRNIITRDGNITAGRSLKAGYETTFAATVVGVEASGDDGTKKWEWYNNAGTSGNNHFSAYERTSGNQGYRFTIREGGNIGIGTTSPDVKLHVNGPILSANALTKIPDDAGITLDYNTNGSKIRAYGDSDGGNLRFEVGGVADSTTGSSEAMRIDKYGNVGIGTTNPSEILTVAKDSDPRLLISNNGSTTGTSSILFGDSSSDEPGRIIYEHINNSLDFYTDQKQRVTIDNVGNVGIGTTNPVGKLTVKSNQGSSAIMLAYNHLNSAVFNCFENANGDGVLALGDASGWDDVTRFPKIKLSTHYHTYFNGGNVGIGTTNPGVKLHTYETGSGQDLRVGFTATNSGGTGVNAYIVYDPDADFLAFSPTKTSSARLGINKDGKVGIGTTSPSSILELGGDPSPEISFNDTNAGDRGSIEFQDGTFNFWSNFTGTGPIAQNATNNFTIRKNGNVGIGTTNPSRILDVQGVQGWEDSNGAERAGLNPAIDGTDFQLFDSSGDSSIRFDTRSGGNSYINNGNVGIGTTNPGDMLHVHASGNGYKALIVEDDSRRIELGRDMIAAKSADGFTVKNLYIQPGGNTAFAINSGKVGIGTTNPDYKLHVDGGGYFAGENMPNAQSENGIYLGLSAGAADAHVSLISPADRSCLIDFSTTGRDAIGRILYANPDATIIQGMHFFADYNGNVNNSDMSISSGGNVGIGTTNPTNRLHVPQYESDGTIGSHDLSKARILVGFTGLGIGIDNNEIVQRGNNLNLSVSGSGTADLSNIRFRTQGETRMSISSDGNVGIGTANPKTALNVRANNSGQGAILTLENSDTSITANDIIGQIDFYANDTSVNGIGAKVNIKGIAESVAGTLTALTFGTSDSNSNTAIERMRIKSNGNVGIGTTNPGGNLDIMNAGTSDATQYLRNNTVTLRSVCGQSSAVIGTTTNHQLSFATNDDIKAVITTAGRVGIGTTSPTHQLQLSTDSAAKPFTNTWTISSDSRAKENIELANLDVCYDNIKNIPLKRYTWSSEFYNEEQVKDRSKIGWIAQDVESVFPKAVDTHEVKYAQKYEEQVIPAVEEVLDEEGNVIQEAQEERVEKVLIDEKIIEDFKSLNADQLYASMYGAIQKLMQKVETLEQEVSDLKGS